MSFKEKSLIELTDFIKKEIPFDSMKKNNGVYETSSLGKSLSGNNITIGVSYEDYEDNGSIREVYYYNIFDGEEYIDVMNGDFAYKGYKLPMWVVNKLKKEICKLIDGE